MAASGEWQAGRDMDALSAKSSSGGDSGPILGSGNLTINAGMSDEMKAGLVVVGVIVLALFMKRGR